VDHANSRPHRPEAGPPQFPAAVPGLGAEVPVYGALDLGTNNCRLLVARESAPSFHVIDAFSRIVRLGERLEASGALCEAAMARTLEALRICAGKLRRRGVTRFRGVATEACRRARNGDKFLDRVERELGLRLEVIAPAEEASLALEGCAPLLDASVPFAVMFDIGGGSTEVTWVGRQEDGSWRILDWVSLPLGVVPFAERFGGDVITADAYTAMVGEITDKLREFDARCSIAQRCEGGEVQMVGTSGTVTTLSGIHQDLPRYERSQVDGSWLDFSAITHVSRTLASLDWRGRAALPCIGPERADLVVAGCAILEAMCTLWPVGRLRVADRGLREGILLGLMRQATCPSPVAQAATF
jgi:exopolyphosphatase / guanosine-5'-triphosphate,3'-diphosphate pyrophosphatase